MISSALGFSTTPVTSVILFKFRSQPRSFFCQSQSQFPLCFARGEQCTPRSLAFWTRVDKECHLQAFNPAQQINLYNLEYEENWKTRELRKSTYRSFFLVFFCHLGLGICPPFRPSRHCICKNVALHTSRTSIRLAERLRWLPVAARRVLKATAPGTHWWSHHNLRTELSRLPRVRRSSVKWPKSHRQKSGVTVNFRK